MHYASRWSNALSRGHCGHRHGWRLIYLETMHDVDSLLSLIAKMTGYYECDCIEITELNGKRKLPFYSLSMLPWTLKFNENCQVSVTFWTGHTRHWNLSDSYVQLHPWYSQMRRFIHDKQKKVIVHPHTSLRQKNASKRRKIIHFRQKRSHWHLWLLRPSSSVKQILRISI